MEYSYGSINNDKKEETEIQKNSFDNIKSKYVLKQIFDMLNRKTMLKIINYCKKIQQRIEITIEDFIELCKVEIEVMPNDLYVGDIRLINIPADMKSYCHIFIDDDPKEYFSETIPREKVVKKVKIILDYQMVNFEHLFKLCGSFKYIHFKRFKRNDITTMNDMFKGCIGLKEINFEQFNTENVRDMNSVFSECFTLKK